MNIRIYPQEVYLLERYISLDYLGDLRDQWSGLVKHVENCLAEHMQGLPMNYRSRPLPEQADVVWGNRILPNFRATLHALNDGFILLSHGDYAGLNSAWGPVNDKKGQTDYSTNWMTPQGESIYQGLMETAANHAHNICITEFAGWQPGNLLKYHEVRGPLNPPEKWPIYQINKRISVSSGKKVQQSGIYIPDVKESCAQFLSSRYKETPPANVRVGVKNIFHPITGEKWDEEMIVEKQSCTWYLVERVADARAEMVAEPALVRHRKMGGNVCKRSGFYFTPASVNSRRFFSEDEIFPILDVSYGKTIWQWDESQ